MNQASLMKAIEGQPALKVKMVSQIQTACQSHQLHDFQQTRNCRIGFLSFKKS